MYAGKTVLADCAFADVLNMRKEKGKFSAKNIYNEAKSKTH